MNKLENKISRLLNRKYCLVTGSGSTSMYLIFLTCKKKGIVIFPTITCIQAVNAAIFAGMKPLFCDVSLNDFTMNVGSLKKILDKHKKNVQMIVPTHVFGNSCDLGKIIEIARKRKIFVLEDAAQSLGSKINDKRTGSIGDASIVSFGHTKILDCGGGGGILTNDSRLYSKVKKLYRKIPKKLKNSKKLFNDYRRIYYKIQELVDQDSKYWKLLYAVQFFYRNVFIYKINKKIKNNINKSLGTLQNNLYERNIRLNLYKKYLKSKQVKHPKNKKGSICWRYTFLYSGNRNLLFKKVRKENIDISSWYPALYKMYTNQESGFFKNSNIIDQQIVNLWVSPEYSVKKITNNIKKVNKILNQL